MNASCHPNDAIAQPISLETLYSMLLKVSEQLDQMKKEMAVARPKEAYTVDEAAERLKRKPYTVRQWCNKGQVKDVYKVRGNGRQGEWRIPHEVLVKLQAEGPGPERGRVEAQTAS
jgi:hypothetical protein